MVSDASVDTFAESLRGEVIQPGDIDYDDARELYNRMIDKRPRVIARCVDVADVIRRSAITATALSPTSGASSTP